LKKEYSKGESGAKRSHVFFRNASVSEKNEPGHQGDVTERIENEVPLEKGPKSRQDEKDGADGQQERQECDDHGIGQELADKLALGRADDLP
jgi:hypothetical protein